MKANEPKKNKTETQKVGLCRIGSFQASGWFEEEVRKHIENLATTGSAQGRGRRSQATGG